jgi:hypothetical protein
VKGYLLDMTDPDLDVQAPASVGATAGALNANHVIGYGADTGTGEVPAVAAVVVPTIDELDSSAVAEDAQINIDEGAPVGTDAGDAVDASPGAIGAAVSSE